MHVCSPMGPVYMSVCTFLCVHIYTFFFLSEALQYKDKKKRFRSSVRPQGKKTKLGNS